jgi:hypothetical protein
MEPKDGDAFSYSAFFDSLLNLEDALVQRIKAFAEKNQARATLVHSGAPLVGVVCRVDLDPLTAEAVLSFRAEFAPQRDSEIPYL